MNTKILFLPLYSEEWASSKYRVYNHLRHFKKFDLTCKVLTPPAPKLLSRIQYYIKLFTYLLWCDVVFIQKKIFRLQIFNAILIFRKKIIFDFDDAIYCYDDVHNDLKYILKHVNLVIVADENLAIYALKFNHNVQVIPTPVELQDSPNEYRNKKKDSIHVGWIGRSWNQHYLAELEDVFDFLYYSLRLDIKLLIMSGEPFSFKNSVFPVVNVPWGQETENEFMRNIDIGLVPLNDDEWSRGKCGYKVLLHMSYGIPVIVSPVGVKKEIIVHGINGYFAETKNDWIESIENLAKDPALRLKIGECGYDKVKREYTYKSISSQLANILRNVR